MITTSYSVKWDTKTKNLLKVTPKKVLHDTARIFLDMTVSSIPRDTGTMRRSTLAYGVKEIENGYQIASNTSYTGYVYEMDNNRTNWTTPGTESEWFDREWRKCGMIAHAQAIARNIIK